MGAEPWGLYPPEVNAGRYESGVGPTAWMVAAAEWAVQVGLVAEAIAVLGLQTGAATGNWEGAASRQFGAASVPFAAWLGEMEAMAASNAKACADVVAAWMAGHGSMIPLPVIVANRVAARTAQVIGMLGAPNTEMVRLELEYSAFWAQNAATMTSYDIAANAATVVKPVPLPPPLVLDAAPGASAMADAVGNAMQQGQQSMMSGGRSMASAGNRMLSGPGGLASRYPGPTLSDTSRWSSLMGSGAGAGFGGGGGGGRGFGGASLSGGGMGAAGMMPGLRAPMASFAPMAPPGSAVGGSSFPGVTNAPSATRPPMPMAPMNPHRGGSSRSGNDSANHEPVMAAVQEFPVNKIVEEDNSVGISLAGESPNETKKQLH